MYDICKKKRKKENKADLRESGGGWLWLRIKGRYRARVDLIFKRELLPDTARVRQNYMLRKDDSHDGVPAENPGEGRGCGHGGSEGRSSEGGDMMLWTR